MHRSGTSALAQTLEALGVSFGDRLISPWHDNPKGYNEHVDILRENRAFLESFGLDPDGRDGELPVEWLYDERTTTFKQRISDIVTSTFAETYLFGIKDPRISILLPAYVDVLQALGIEVRVVVSVRSIASVAASLEKRNGTPLAASVRAYEYFYRIIRMYTKEIPTVFIAYDELLTDTRAAVNKLIKGVHPALRPYDDAAHRLSTILDPGLTHHHAQDDQLLLEMARSTLRLERELDELKQARSTDMDWWHSKLDALASISVFAKEQLAHAKHWQGRYQETSVQLAEQHAAHLAERSALEEKISAAQAERAAAEEKITALNRHIAHEADRAAARDSHHEARIRSLTNEVEAMHVTITNIERSFVWKCIRSWDKVIHLILPRGTVIRRLYDALIAYEQHFFNEVVPRHIVRRMQKMEPLPIEDSASFWESFRERHPVTDVLFVTHDETRTGAPRIVLDIAKHMQTRCSVAMASLGGGSMHDLFTETFGEIIYPEQLMPSGDPVARATHVLTELKPKVVYVNSIVSHSFAKAARTLGIPVVFHVHELDIAFQIVFSRKELAEFKHLADTFIAVSQPVYDLLVHSLGCSPEHVLFAHEFVDAQAVLAASTQVPVELVEQEIGSTNGEVVVFALGSFIYRKGADLFMQLAKRLHNRGLPVRCVWMGGRPFKEPFMADFKQYAPYFSLLHERENPFPYLAAADIFVLPSREDPFPLAVLEAMSLGKPCVVFEGGGGSKEAIKDAGIIVSEMTIDMLEEAVVRLVQNGPTRASLGERARMYQQAYDSSVVIPKLEQCIMKYVQLPANAEAND
jgi:glycosyltransferase involved in cell wall biosynthesis